MQTKHLLDTARKPWAISRLDVILRPHRRHQNSFQSIFQVRNRGKLANGLRQTRNIIEIIIGNQCWAADNDFRFHLVYQLATQNYFWWR